MSDDFLSLRSHTRTNPAPTRPPTPDLAFASLSLLTRLREALKLSAKLMAACRHAESVANRRKRSGVPKLFFFDDARTELADVKFVVPKFPEPYLSQLVLRMPAEAHAWNELPDLLDDALTALPAAVAVRRTARAFEGMRDAALELAPLLPAAAELAELLAVPDDQVVLAIQPAARVGVRVRVRGVAEVNQLHAFLADALTGDPARGLLPGRRPHPRVMSAYRDTDPDPDLHEMSSRFQLYRPDALQPDGTLPDGFAGSDFWVWGEDSPAALPLERGERVVLLGDPVYQVVWAVRRKFPRLRADAEVVEVLSRADVERWLSARCPHLPKEKPAVRTAAA